MALAVLHTGLGNMFSAHTHTQKKVDRLHLMVADTCEHTVLKAAYHKDDEMVNVVTVSAAT